MSPCPQILPQCSQMPDGLKTSKPWLEQTWQNSQPPKLRVNIVTSKWTVASATTM